MKLCWDTLNNIRLSKGGRLYSLPHKESIEFGVCSHCGEEMIYRPQNVKSNLSDNLYCTIQCKNDSTRILGETSKERNARYAKKSNNTLRGWARIIRWNVINRVKERGLQFDLPIDWFEERLKQGCALTRLDFVKSDGPGPNPFSPTTDRVDPNGGYTTDNCRLILNAVNALKGSGTDEQMFTIARALLEKTGL